MKRSQTQGNFETTYSSSSILRQARVSVSRIWETIHEINPILDNHLETSTVFLRTSGTVQNNIINAIGNVLINEIKSEISNAKFVSIMFDKTTAVINKS